MSSWAGMLRVNVRLKSLPLITNSSIARCSASTMIPVICKRVWAACWISSALTCQISIGLVDIGDGMGSPN